MAKGKEKAVYNGMFECEECQGQPYVDRDVAGYYTVGCGDCGRETKYKSLSIDAAIKTWNFKLTEKAA